MKQIIALFFVIMLLLPCGSMPAYAEQAKAETTDDSKVKGWDDPDLRLKLNQIAEENGVKACSIVAFETDNILFSHSWGVARHQAGKAVPASSTTKYRSASISKMVAGMLVMMLCQQDKLSLDDDIALLIDKRLKNPDYPNQPPKIRHMLTHTTGIVDGAAYNHALASWPFQTLNSLLSNGIAFGGYPPGEGFAYSNFGMGLAAAVVENGSGQYFHEYAYNALFKPMGIDAGYMTDNLSDKSQVAAMWGADPLSWGEMKRAYAAIPLGQMYLLAQGELYISAEDLARVSMILAGNGTYGGKTYLNPETVDKINTLYAHYPDTSMGYGLAVQATEEIIPGQMLFGHQGNAYGAISCVFYQPKTGRGVVFLSSGARGDKLKSGVYRVNQDVVQRVWGYF